ncbi:MAG TPA: UDP-N-acetylmuramoyl-tripeptide--D-alanyl-D-alanine ligase [Vicinamibacterales bacterium]
MTGVETARMPLTLTAAEIASAVSGDVRAGDGAQPIERFSIDSRSIAPGDFFIALKGERFDGGAFAAESLARGAAGVLVDRATRVDVPGALVIEVDDTLTALQELGRYVRRLSSAAVVAVTGSAGKTSTKEAAAGFLSARYTVYRNRGNLNNHIGLPLSLLDLRARPDIAVVELGMNHAGEIRRLVELAEPDVRVWTNVGDAHLGHFASAEAIADAKAEVLEGATRGTRVVANADDPLVMARVARTDAEVVTFGLGQADVRAIDVRDRGVQGTTAVMVTPAGRVDVHVPLPGRGPLLNVLAAAAVALLHGVALDAIAARAARLTAAPRRGEVVRLGRGVVLIDDSYNSSPAALAGALAALASETGARRRVAVLGEMRELGDFSVALHEESGRHAAAAGVDLLVGVGGDPARAMVNAARDAGLPAERTHYWASSDEAAAPVSALLEPDDVVLVKGSRGTRTDIVADRIRAEWS